MAKTAAKPPTKSAPAAAKPVTKVAAKPAPAVAKTSKPAAAAASKSASPPASKSATPAPAAPAPKPAATPKPAALGAASPAAAAPPVRTTGLSPREQRLLALRQKLAHQSSGAKPLPGASAQSFNAKSFAGKKTLFNRKAV